MVKVVTFVSCSVFESLFIKTSLKHLIQVSDLRTTLRRREGGRRRRREEEDGCGAKREGGDLRVNLSTEQNKGRNS